MSENREEHHNGHSELPTGAERVRSGFDRRRNWGDSIENVYRRIDHRLTELVRTNAAPVEEAVKPLTDAARKSPWAIMAACFSAGLLAGLWMAKGRE